MGSIPKIVSTPLKWVSKKILHQTLLRFPGGDSHSPVACVYCPEMCRFSCPTAVVTGNDVVTPCNKMSALYKEQKWPGQVAQGGPLWPIYDCTGCGRCTEYCVYGMPVAEKLFDARKNFKWDVAEQVAARLTDETDRVGDLADELGDVQSAQRRLHQFLGTPPKTDLKVIEPRSLFFLSENGVPASLTWENYLDQPLSKEIQKKLSGKRWLFHESVWHTRHLRKGSSLSVWLKAAESVGVQIQLPFAHGKDCIDCGGEGAYSQLFPSQSIQMAREFWERDQHRVDGILCVSSRCAEHFRSALGQGAHILSLAEILSKK